MGLFIQKHHTALDIFIAHPAAGINFVNINHSNPEQFVKFV